MNNSKNWPLSGNVNINRMIAYQGGCHKCGRYGSGLVLKDGEIYHSHCAPTDEEILQNLRKKKLKRVLHQTWHKKILYFFNR